MSRKDYELIADNIHVCVLHAREHDNLEGLAILGRLVNTLAQDLERDNERFDSARFKAACGF